MRQGTEGPVATTNLVLYVEDNPANVKLVERIFKLRPHLTLQTATNGEDGLDLARQHQPDLVVLDVNLPDINGDVVLRRLQEDSNTSGIPVVILSADATQGKITSFLDAGAAEYVTKPLDLGHFLSVIDRILAGAS